MSRARAADVAATCAILLAGALSTAWVFIVPIFQANDEAAHFDYAISILSERHPNMVARNTQWIVSPYARYLLRATDYFRIAFHSSMRVPPGYGTLPYYRRLDAGAPSLSEPGDASAPISYIASRYPSGFYALEGAWMKIIASLTGSLTAVFFGARLLCVLLTMLGLHFSYRTAVNIGVPRWIGVALVAAVGFFPLTTAVSSYVQPDNLAYMLVSASLYFATQLRSSKRPLIATTGLGISLGFLAITKYQFFVSAAIPTTLFALVRLWLERVKPPAAAVRAALLSLPSILLLALQFSFAKPTYSDPGGGAQSASFFTPFYDQLQNGISAALVYFFQSAVSAFKDFFLTGPNVSTYWGALGSGDTPLIIVNQQVELAIRIVISLGSLTVALLIAYRIASNLFRLGGIAWRGRPSQAVRLLVDDPVLNSYLLFVLIMLALYVGSDNAFGATGRQWYPYIFSGFLCAAWYAPRALPRTRRSAPIVATLIAAYALASSGYATAAIIQRYYGKPSGHELRFVPRPAQIAPGRAVGSLWPVQGMDLRPFFPRFRDNFTTGSRLWAGGAAIFPNWHQAAREVSVVIDDRLATRTLAGQYNFQLAEATKDLAYGYSGFFAPFGTTGLSEGAHVVSAYAKVPHSDAYQAILPRRSFFLLPGAQFSKAFLSRLARAPLASGTLDELHPCRRGFPAGAGPSAVAAGDVIAASGSLTGLPPRDGDYVVWLLVDKKPYSTVVRDDGSFLGAIPAADFSAGVHHVTAYLAVPQRSAYFRVSPLRKFIATRRSQRLQIMWAAPPLSAECYEALRIAAGADT